MKTGDSPSKKLSKDQYLSYWKKAREFEAMMEESLLQQNWNAAALNAVHSAILANDALLIYFHGRKSTSQKHDDAVRLLTSLMKSNEAKKNAKHLRKLIGEKSTVEYTGRLFSPTRSKELCKHAQRFNAWVHSQLPATKEGS